MTLCMANDLECSQPLPMTSKAHDKKSISFNLFDQLAEMVEKYDHKSYLLRRYVNYQLFLKDD